MNQDKKFCPNCGEQLNIEDKFCQTCGFNFETREFPRNEENKIEVKDKSKKNKQLGLIGGAIFILCVVVYFVINKNTVSIAGTYMPSDLPSGAEGLIEISRNGNTKIILDDFDFEESIEVSFYIDSFGNDTYRIDDNKDVEFRYAAPIDMAEFDSAEEDIKQYEGVTLEYDNGMGILSGKLPREEIEEFGLFSIGDFELKESNGQLFGNDELLIKQ